MTTIALEEGTTIDLTDEQVRELLRLAEIGKFRKAGRVGSNTMKMRQLTELELVEMILPRSGVPQYRITDKGLAVLFAQELLR